MNIAKKCPFYYGWIIVLCSSLLIAAVIGTGYNCWTVFTIPICESLGITRQQFSGLYTALLLGQIVGSLGISRLTDRLKLIHMLRAGVVFLSTLMFGLSKLHSVYGLYLGGFFIGICLIPTSFFALSIIIANWFQKSRGIATGIVFMSSGLGSMFLIPMSNVWITKYGWRLAVFYLFLIVTVISVPLAFLGLKEKPEDMGLRPYGEEDTASTQVDQETNWAVTQKDLVRMPTAWFFAIYIIGTYFVGMLGSTVVPYLCDSGYSPNFAAMIHSGNLGVTAVSRVVVGRLCDRHGSIHITCVSAMLVPLMLIGLIFAPYSPVAVILSMLGFGVGQATITVSFPLITRVLFGRKHFTSVYGVYNAVGNSVGAIAPLIYGGLYTKTSSYLISYQIFLVGTVVGAAALFMAVGIHRKQRLISTHS